MHATKSFFGVLAAVILMSACQTDITGPTMQSTAPAAAALAKSAPTFNFTAALTLPGSFVVDRVVYGNKSAIYAGSYQRSTFVLARNASQNFPLTATLTFNAAVTAIRGDSQQLLISTADCYVNFFTPTTSPTPLGSIQVCSNNSVGDLDLQGNLAIAGFGSAHVAQSDQYVFVATLSTADSAVKIDTRTKKVVGSYGRILESDLGSTIVYNKSSGAKIKLLPNPAAGRPNLLIYNNFLYQAVPGPYGTGVNAWNLKSWSPTFKDLKYANTVAYKKNGNLLFIGTEAGTVVMMDAKYNVLSTLNLRSAIGCSTNWPTNNECVEVRSLWVDDYDSYVFAGSTWGRADDLTLPSFFVARLN